MAHVEFCPCGEAITREWFSGDNTPRPTFLGRTSDPPRQGESSDFCRVPHRVAGRRPRSRSGLRARTQSARFLNLPNCAFDVCPRCLKDHSCMHAPASQLGPELSSRRRVFRSGVRRDLPQCLSTDILCDRLDKAARPTPSKFLSVQFTTAMIWVPSERLHACVELLDLRSQSTLDPLGLRFRQLQSFCSVSSPGFAMRIWRTTQPPSEEQAAHGTLFSCP